MAGLITAAEEYAKDPLLQPADIAQLRDWLSKQCHLPQCITDEFLIAILHSSNYSLQKAKDLLETNITCRTNYTELFSGKDPFAKEKQAVWDFIDFWLSPHQTKEKYRILFGGLCNYDPSVFDFASLANVFFSMVDTTVGELGVCPGYVIVLDSREVNLTHLARCNFNHIRNVLHYVQEAIQIKIKAIHVIYVTPVIHKILFAIKPFLKKELLDILHFHSGEMVEFYSAVPRELLPQEIGGTNGHKQELIKTTRDRIERRKEWLIEGEKLKLDESRRINLKTSEHNMIGSFRALAVD